MSTEKKEVLLLLIEDDNQVVLFFELAIRLLPFPTILTAPENRTMMKQTLEKLFPDVIFIDINLSPHMSGWECLRDIRSDKKYDNTPVVMFSADYHKEDVAAAFQSGANLYMQKPARLRKLVSHLEDILKIDWSTRPVGASSDNLLLDRA